MKYIIILLKLSLLSQSAFSNNKDYFLTNASAEVSIGVGLTSKTSTNRCGNAFSTCLVSKGHFVRIEASVKDVPLLNGEKLSEHNLGLTATGKGSLLINYENGETWTEFDLNLCFEHSNDQIRKGIWNTIECRGVQLVQGENSIELHDSFTREDNDLYPMNSFVTFAVLPKGKLQLLEVDLGGSKAKDDSGEVDQDSYIELNTI